MVKKVKRRVAPTTLIKLLLLSAGLIATIALIKSFSQPITKGESEAQTQCNPVGYPCTEGREDNCCGFCDYSKDQCACLKDGSTCSSSNYCCSGYCEYTTSTCKTIKPPLPTAGPCGSAQYPQCKNGSCAGGKVCKQSGNTCKCVTPSTSHSIKVRASGTPAGGVYPQFQVIIAGRVEATYTVNGTLTDYRYARSWAINPQDVRIKFINDAVINGQDRNLRVDRITIDDDTVYETEAPSTYTYTPGCTSGYNNTEWIWCNGYFQYLAR